MQEIREPYTWPANMIFRSGEDIKRQEVRIASIDCFFGAPKLFQNPSEIRNTPKDHALHGPVIFFNHTERSSGCGINLSEPGTALSNRFHACRKEMRLCSRTASSISVFERADLPLPIYAPGDLRIHRRLLRSEMLVPCLGLSRSQRLRTCYGGGYTTGPNRVPSQDADRQLLNQRCGPGCGGGFDRGKRSDGP